MFDGNFSIGPTRFKSWTSMKSPSTLSVRRNRRNSVAAIEVGDRLRCPDESKVVQPFPSNAMSEKSTEAAAGSPDQSRSSLTESKSESKQEETDPALDQRCEMNLIITPVDV
jgi:hypothetical protein